MNPVEVEFLRRLHAERPLFRRSQLAKTLARHEGLGAVNGARVNYSEADWKRAGSILRTRGYSVEATPTGFTREQAPAGGSEKTGARPVSHGLVAVVPLNMASNTPAAPAGGYIGMPWDSAMALPYEVLLVCENLEPLLNLQRHTWLEAFVRGRPTLAVFRGTVQLLGTAAAASLIAADTRPVLAFFDFDPKGLQMAAALPRREALCLPPLEVLESIAKRLRRDHLFANSLDICRPGLDAARDLDIANAWKAMKAWGTGLNQESFCGSPQ